MKTAISVPDTTFARVDERAKQLGMSRSEFFTRAAEDFLTHLDETDLTRRYDEALTRGGRAVEAEAREAATIGSASLAALTERDDW